MKKLRPKQHNIYKLNPPILLK